MSAKKPKLPKAQKPSKAVIARLEAEGFIEEPLGPKPPLPTPVPTKLKKGESIAEIVTSQRR